MRLDALLPFATLLTGLAGSAMTHYLGRPWWVAWLGLALVVCGMLGIERDED